MQGAAVPDHRGVRRVLLPVCRPARRAQIAQRKASLAAAQTGGAHQQLLRRCGAVRSACVTRVYACQPAVSQPVQCLCRRFGRAERRRGQVTSVIGAGRRGGGSGIRCAAVQLLCADRRCRQTVLPRRGSARVGRGRRRLGKVPHCLLRLADGALSLQQAQSRLQCALRTACRRRGKPRERQSAVAADASAVPTAKSQRIRRLPAPPAHTAVRRAQTAVAPSAPNHSTVPAGTWHTDALPAPPVRTGTAPARRHSGRPCRAQSTARDGTPPPGCLPAPPGGSIPPHCSCPAGHPRRARNSRPDYSAPARNRSLPPRRTSVPPRRHPAACAIQ